MKNFIPYTFLALICFAIFSCQTTLIEISEQSDENTLINSISDITNSQDISTPTNPLTPDQSHFINQMQWFSFISAELLFHDTDDNYRTQIILLANSNTHTISANDLLGSNPINTSFKSDFITLFEMHIDSIPHNDCEGAIGRPEEMEDRPGGAPSIPDVYEFLEFIVDDNCIELYFPNNLIIGLSQESLEISSTAHPLTTNQSNLGWKRVINMNPCSGTLEVLIDIPYINNNQNIIIARPYKVSMNPICYYNEYSFSFLNFLNNSF